MALNIDRNGIVFRQDRDTVAILQPGRNGGAGAWFEVSAALSEEYQLAAGDIVEGTLEPIVSEPAPPEREWEQLPDWDRQFDEPDGRSHGLSMAEAVERPVTYRLTAVTRINGLPDSPSVEEADAFGFRERPAARSQRSRSERTPPDRLLTLARSARDFTGRTLDFAAPLGAGVFGLIYGPHGSGLTRTLQAVLNGIVRNAPDCVPLVLLLRARAEEATEWRRRFPEADIVVGASALGESLPEQILQIGDLMLEAAQRQTELGRDVVLLVDSLTALWGALLEAEEADAQREADMSQARRRIREWVQRAGCFHGTTPLGGGLGGSLTVIGTVWHQAIDAEAEEENDLHPHLRLLEHLLPEADWRVPLSEALAQKRLYPAIDIRNCRSRAEESLLPEEIREAQFRVRGRLPDRDPVSCYLRVQGVLEASQDLSEMLQRLE